MHFMPFQKSPFQVFFDPSATDLRATLPWLVSSALLGLMAVPRNFSKSKLFFVVCNLQILQLWIISHYLRFLTSPRARGIQHKGFVSSYSSEPSMDFCCTWKSLEPRPQTWLWFTPRSGFQSSPRFAVWTSWRKKKHRCVVALCAEDPWNVASIVEQKLLWRDKNLWCVQSLPKTLAHTQIFTKVFESTWTT